MFFTKQIYEIWLPAAVHYGIDINTFWKLNPKIMYIYQDAYLKKKKDEMQTLDIQAYFQGMYVQNAIASCFNKKAKYPKKPLSLKREEQSQLEDLSEQDYYKAMRRAIRGMNKQFEE